MFKIREPPPRIAFEERLINILPASQTREKASLAEKPTPLPACSVAGNWKTLCNSSQALGFQESLLPGLFFVSVSVSFSKASWLRSDPLVKPKKTVTKRTKEFIRHQTDSFKIKRNWRKPRGAEHRVRLGYGATRKPSTCCPVAFGSSWLADLKELEVLLMCTNLTVLRMLRASPQRAAEPLRRQPPGWPSRSPIPMPGCAAKKGSRYIVYTLCLCY